MALGDYVAHLEFAGLSAPKQVGSRLDKPCAEIVAKKTERQARKSEKDVSKEWAKLEVDMGKLDRETR